MVWLEKTDAKERFKVIVERIIYAFGRGEGFIFKTYVKNPKTGGWTCDFSYVCSKETAMKFFQRYSDYIDCLDRRCGA